MIPTTVVGFVLLFVAALVAGFGWGIGVALGSKLIR